MSNAIDPNTADPNAIDAVLFDLDGTLADTAPDLATALNKLRAEHDLAPLPYELIRGSVSEGTVAMLATAFGINADAPEFEQRRQRLLEIYAAGLCEQTRLFSGMETVLIALAQAGIQWGVVTNKPGHLTDPLMAQLPLPNQACVIVSGDTLSVSKPHPEPLLHACSLANLEPERCWYVGDAARDIEAGRAAGMPSIAVRWGYFSPTSLADSWGADYVAETPEDILQYIGLLATE